MGAPSICSRGARMRTCRAIGAVSAAPRLRPLYMTDRTYGRRPRSPEQRHAGRAIPKRRTGRISQCCASRTGSASRRPARRNGAETQAIVRENRPRHGVRGGRLPQYRRVLGEEARHLHDHGRHLHARLRLLQRQDRHARRARPATSPSNRRSRRQSSGLAHVVITSVDRDDLDDGGARAFRRR